MNVNKATCFLCGAVVLIFSALCIFLPKSDFSESERRVLAAFPELSAESIFSGGFAAGLEEYATDSFPFRDVFRGIKAYTSEYGFLKLDNNGVFSRSGHLSTLNYPLSIPMLDHAAERFSYINEAYLKSSGARVYLSIIPDKNYFMSTLKLDYSQLTSYMREKMPFASYIDIFPSLSLSDYYKTDSHWRQECIQDTALTLSAAMGAEKVWGYTVNAADKPFYGVYAGQSAKYIFKPDTLKYITNDIINSCTVTSYDTGSPAPAQMYDMEKADGRDPYEMFLSGGSALLTVENPKAETERELIIFRDSFASSLAHHLIPGYRRITLVDIRYINSSMLGGFVDFKDADVLFLYSTTLLNNSLALK